MSARCQLGVRVIITHLNLNEHIKEIALAKKSSFQFYLQRHYEERDKQLENHRWGRKRRFPYKVGDFVLVAFREQLNSTWTSPRKIVKRVSDWEYEFQDLETNYISRNILAHFKW